MNNQEGIHKAPKFGTVEKPTTSAAAAEEKEKVSTLPKFNISKSGASVNYREPLKTDRPKNVYVELIDGKYWLWYNTEKGQEIGIKRNFVTDDMTQIKSEYGYDCNIPATKQNIALLKESAFAGTQYMFKDAGRRIVIDTDKFIEEAKL